MAVRYSIVNCTEKKLHLCLLTLNLYHNGKYIICKNITLLSRPFSNDARDYHQFCTMFGLKQIIKFPNRITCWYTTLIDHIIASIPSRISQHSIINVSVSDHLSVSVYLTHINYCSFKSTLLMLIK